ncbi:MAG: PAS domain S-box protein [Acidobacteriota bacterium]|nr:PAS domain S-box protein [Blastocatellia bacterium]MDW8411115.1 PAS domain S-box protein [Acidobacteriota bacterium]
MRSEGYRILLVETDEKRAEKIAEACRTISAEVRNISDFTQATQMQGYDLIIADAQIVPCSVELQSTPVMLTDWRSQRVFLDLGRTQFLENVTIENLPQVARRHIETTELKHIFAEAKSAIGFQSLLLESIRDVIIGVDTQGEIVYWNRGAEVTFGYSSEQVLGTDIRRFFPEKAAQLEWFDELKLRLAEGDVVEEWRACAAGDQIKWLSVFVRLLRTSQGDLVLFVAQDITRGKQLLEQATKQAEHTAIINRVLKIVTASHVLDEMLQMIAKLLEEVFVCRVKIAHKQRLDESNSKNVQVFLPSSVGSSLAVLELRTKERSWTVSLLRPESCPWSSVDAELLDEVGAILSVAMEKALLHEASKTAAERERLINAIAQSTLSSLDIDKIIQTVCDELGKLLNVSRCYFNKVYCESRTSFISYEYCRPEFPTLKGAVFSYDQFGEEIEPLSLGKTLVFNTAREAGISIRRFALQYGIASLMVVPVLVDNQIIGTVSLNQCDYERVWTVEEQHLVEALARQCAVALRNAKLYVDTRSSELRYRTLFENANDAILIVDLLSERILDANSRAELLTGYERSALLKISMSDLVAAEDLAEYGELYKELSQLRSVRISQLRIRRHDSTYLHAELTASLLGTEDSSVIQVLLRDLTEQLRLEKQLINAQRLESLGSLTGGIAHDFNNLLAGILGYAELLRKKLDPSSTKLQYYASVIEQSAKRGSELAKRLVAFARGGKPLLEIMDLNSVVSETVQLLMPALGRSVEVLTELDDKLLPIEANASQMQQVVMNLCINARDAMKSGGTILIKTCNRSFSPSQHKELVGEYVQLTVRDTGCGIEESILAHIFEPFFTTKEEGKGTGLGLAMVSVIVRELRGKIEVSSTVGQGTTFDIYIPAASSSFSRQTAETPAQTIYGQETILVVDDEEALRGLAKDLLESFGYKVLLAANGFEALELFKKHSKEISLVILDMVMPKMDGRQLFYELRKLSSEVPVVVASGYCPPELLEELYRDGISGLIPKPYQSEAMAAEVRKVINSMKAAGEKRF